MTKEEHNVTSKRMSFLVFFLYHFSSHIAGYAIIGIEGFSFAAICCVLTRCWEQEVAGDSESREEEGIQCTGDPASKEGAGHSLL